MPTFTLQFTAALLLGLGTCIANAATLNGRVFRIDSGDTVTVLDASNRQNKVRLTGIAAPDRLQSFGSRSQANLGALLSGQDVSVIWNSRDRDGSLLGQILVAAPGSACRLQPDCPRTLDAGLQQLTDGMAWWHQTSISAESPVNRASYQQAEFDAKIHRRGLWADTNPIPPWQWRPR